MKKINNIFLILLLTLSIIFLAASIYIKKEFGSATFEQLLYSLKFSKGSSTDALKQGIVYVLITVLITLIILIISKILMKKFMKYNYKIEISIKNKKFSYYVLKFSTLKKNIYVVSIFVISILFSFYNFKFFEYAKYQISNSNIFEGYYLEPRNINIEFGENKKNLIYIYVESMESTNFSLENGGGFSESLIPGLQKLSKDNINFSNTDTIGGYFSPYGATWTAGAIVASTSGVPLKLPINGNLYSGYSESLPGAYSLGEILLDNGYKNYFMMGSESTFGGRKDYLEQHGDYEIFDYIYAKENNLIGKNYKEWWGFEDLKLFEYAKEKLTEIASTGNNYNFTILTADTHFPDGYMDSSCDTPYDNAYKNALYCSDSKVYDFVKWIQSQPFYEDAVIVIVGDHLTMQAEFYIEKNDFQNTTRAVYNTFINSAVSTYNTNNRVVTTFDLYPTTLAAMGATIEGERIGFGTNLFSDYKTVAEEIGLEEFNEKLKNRSDFYNEYLLGDTYNEMLEEYSQDNSAE